MDIDVESVGSATNPPLQDQPLQDQPPQDQPPQDPLLQDPAPNPARPRLLVAVTCTPGASNFPEICRNLATFADIKLISTRNALNCFHRPTLAREHLLYTDDDLRTQLLVNPNENLYIELASWGQAFVIAPCSANTIAKIATGICNTLVTLVAKAWVFPILAQDGSQIMGEDGRPLGKPILLFPDMEGEVWADISTNNHINELLGRGASVCNNGGRLGAPQQVVETILHYLPF